MRQLSKTFWYRTALIAVLVLLAVLMFVIGRQHSILIDNKAIEIDGAEHKAFSLCQVRIDGLEEKELARRDRIEVKVQGQRHKITLSYVDSSNNDKTLEVRFRVPLGEDMVLISLPALAAGLEQGKWLSPFKSMTISNETEQTQPEESVSIDDAAAAGFDF
ncbi:MAG: DUF6672 family protein [Sphaerochaetaceae bacterium]